MSAEPGTEPVVVKRYARSRLYDVTHESYVAVEQLREWAASRVAFTVVDAETDEDIANVLLS